ncbi:hypothetical protein MKZ91_31295, partial [Ensifer sp. MJa1]
MEFALSFDVADGYAFEDNFEHPFGIVRPVTIGPRSMMDKSEYWDSSAIVDRNDNASLNSTWGDAGLVASGASSTALGAKDTAGQPSGGDKPNSMLRSLDGTASEPSPSTEAVMVSALAAPTIFETRVVASADDAEERSSGSMSLNSSDLELTVDDGVGQTVGIRFIGIDIPKGAIITNAYIQFTVDEVSTGTI